MNPLVDPREELVPLAQVLQITQAYVTSAKQQLDYYNQKKAFLCDTSQDIIILLWEKRLSEAECIHNSIVNRFREPSEDQP
jgi:hypothetical protein